MVTKSLKFIIFQDYNSEIKSFSAAAASLTLVTPVANYTPDVPKSMALTTSLPFLIPAPHKIPTSPLTSRIARAVPITISGSAVVTDISPPINSGGSTAT